MSKYLLEIRRNREDRYYFLYATQDNIWKVYIEEDTRQKGMYPFYNLDSRLIEGLNYLVESYNKKEFLIRDYKSNFNPLRIYIVDNIFKEIFSLIKQIRDLVFDISEALKKKVRMKEYYRYSAKLEKINILSKLMDREYKKLKKELEKFLVTERLLGSSDKT